MSPATILTGHFLVRGAAVQDTTTIHPARHHVVEPHPLLLSEVSLSFWGGIDPLTGIVVDASHPLHGQCVTDTVLCLPSGRGSCTASQVLLELILNHKAPKAFCFRDVDGLACVGAIVAQEVFQQEVPDMIHIGTQAFHELVSEYQQDHPNGGATHASILYNGNLVVGKYGQVQARLDQYKEEQNEISHPFIPVRQLTEQEQSMIDNATTEAQRMAYRVIFQYAHLGAPATPPTYETIKQAHIDGCTYIGPGGLEFTQRLVQANGKVQVPTTLNSVSADRRHHERLGVPAEYAANSIALGDAYLALGCQPSFTCAPYLLPSTPPKLGDQIAWGESNAVVYANSVLGARTEKYADYLDICCAITGIVPAVGVHLEENRTPRIVLDATDILDQIMRTYQSQTQPDNSNSSGSSGIQINLEMLFPTLGHVCGSLSDGKVPILVGFNTPEWIPLVTKDHLKAFCAAFGTTGTSPLVHIDGITPEAQQYSSLLLESEANASMVPLKKTVTWEHCQETFATLNSAMKSSSSHDDNGDVKIDLIALGNPHLSLQECHNLVKLIQNMSLNASTTHVKKHPNVRIMACISRAIYSQAEELGYVSFLTEFGVEFINDTCWCMLLDPPVIPPHPDATILTNSGKYAHYGPGLTNRKYRYGSTEDCVHVAITGEYPCAVAGSAAGMPSWLLSRSHVQQQRSFTSGSHFYSRPLAPMYSWRTRVPAEVPRQQNFMKRYALRAVRNLVR